MSNTNEKQGRIAAYKSVLAWIKSGMNSEGLTQILHLSVAELEKQLAEEGSPASQDEANDTFLRSQGWTLQEDGYWTKGNPHLIKGAYTTLEALELEEHWTTR